ncbi:MAG: hypothetical protein Q7S96_02895 [bacterium]|nr:hypothetical protein [bacterium]
MRKYELVGFYKIAKVTMRTLTNHDRNGARLMEPINRIEGNNPDQHRARSVHDAKLQLRAVPSDRLTKVYTLRLSSIGNIALLHRSSRIWIVEPTIPIGTIDEVLVHRDKVDALACKKHVVL